MFEIDRNAVTRWGHKREINDLPLNIKIDCPSCGISLVNCNLDFTQGYNQEVYHARVVCMACRQPAHIFAMNWSPNNDTKSLNARYYIDPSPRPNIYLPADVDYQSFSPRFVEVYRQAAEAEAKGFNEIVGMGYRKALEMLITDYLIAEQPDNRDSILRDTLSGRIDRFAENPQLQRAAKHAAWLGNDETHYDRLHPDANLDDLKKFLALALDWISMEVKAKAIDKVADARKKVKTPQ